MGLSLLSVFWGKAHLELFEKACIKSLSFPNNLKSLINENAVWNIFSDEEFQDKIELVVRNELPGFTNINFQNISKLRARCDLLHEAIIWQIEECLATSNKMFLAMPDTIIGDGTIENLLAIASEPNTCIASPHPRVLPSILNEKYQSNSSLVTAAMKHPHASWTYSEESHPLQSSYIGGISWKRLNEKLISVKHYLPTPYLCQFTKEDLNYFKIIPQWGYWDHEWPAHLIKQGRYRIATSSDIAFVVEITEQGNNRPPIPKGIDNQHSFWKLENPRLKTIQHEMNHCIRCTFREE